MDLLELARTNPEITISIRVGDLITAARTIIADTRAELEGTIAAERADFLIPREDVVDILKVDPSTLYRWEKEYGYLIPVRRGTRVFYRNSDIQPILNGTRPKPNSKITHIQK
ncbi:MAG: MerR family transcriptional regulator [Oscillibacter sp.]|nr:MerR family transcriptional regulator [Oscillibacter sp.]